MRAVYYAVLGAVVVWGVIALRLAQPIVLLQIGANVAGVIFVIASLHLLYLNTRLLPPSCARRSGAARRWSPWRSSTGSSRLSRSGAGDSRCVSSPRRARRCHDRSSRPCCSEPRRSSGSSRTRRGDRGRRRGAAVQALDQNGKNVDLAGVAKNGFTLVYFYPKADTPGCTKQACSLRDSFAQLTERGVKVFGVSHDTVEAQKAFVEKYKLPSLCSPTPGRRSRPPSAFRASGSTRQGRLSCSRTASSCGATSRRRPRSRPPTCSPRWTS